MSESDEHRFTSIEERLKSIEEGMVKRDIQLASIMLSLARIEALLGGSLGSQGIVSKVESTHSKIMWASGFGAALGFLAEYFLGKLKP